MLNMSSGFLCDSDWQNLLTSRRQAARSCSPPCPSAQPIPKVNVQRVAGINRPFRTAISTISLRDRPSSGLNSRSATVFLNLVGGVSFFQSRRRSRADGCPLSSPHPPNPDEVGADILSNELWPSRDNILLSSTFNLVCSIYVTPSLIRPHARASKQTNLANLRALSAS